MEYSMQIFCRPVVELSVASLWAYFQLIVKVLDRPGARALDVTQLGIVRLTVPAGAPAEKLSFMHPQSMPAMVMPLYVPRPYCQSLLLLSPLRPIPITPHFPLVRLP